MRNNLRALLIGIDHYPHASEQDLRGAAADVVGMRDFLLGQGVPENNIRCLLSSKDATISAPSDGLPTYANLVHEIRGLGLRAAPQGRVLLHYSGHGARTPTLIPRQKGAGQVDECLVPCDLAADGSRWLRDVELTYLLDEMLRRDLRVTVILDACHSGGMMRGSETWRRRRLAAASENAPLRSSLVAESKELELVWRRVHHHATSPKRDTSSRMRSSSPRSGKRSAQRGVSEQPRGVWRHVIGEASGWVAPGILGGGGMTILSACRPRESALEHKIDGQVRGALTSGLLHVLETLDSDQLTWQQVLLRLTARLRRMETASLRPQTPLLEGGTSELWFVAPQSSGNRFLVKEIDRQGRRVLLGGGRAWGIHPGAIFEVERRDPPSNLEVKVEAAAANEAWALLTTLSDDLVGLEIGAEARWLSPGEEWKQRVTLVGCDPPPEAIPRAPKRVLRNGQPLAVTEVATRQILTWLRDAVQSPKSFVSEASVDTPADWQLRIDRGQCQICHGDGRAVTGLEKVRIADVHDAKQMVKRLQHLARFRYLDTFTREHSTRDSGAMQPGDRLDLSLGLLPVGFELGSEMEPDVLEGDRPRVPADRWVALQIGYRGLQALHVYVVALRWDWSVAWLYPKEGSHSVQETDSCQMLPFRVALPAGSAGGIEILKVIATTEPLGMSEWTLPALTMPVARRLRGRGGATQENSAWRGRATLKPGTGSKFRNSENFWVSGELAIEVVLPSS